MEKKPIRLKLNAKTVKLGTGAANEINLFDLGCLIQLETHEWGANKRISKSELEKLTPEQKEGWIHASRSLINKEHLTKINSIIREARNFLWGMSSPFPIKAVNFISKDLLTFTTEKLDNYIIQLQREIDAFIPQYVSFIEEAQEFLEPMGLFNTEYYPSKQDIGNKFKMKYFIYELTFPKSITEDIRNTEMEKYKKLIVETRNEGILAMREGFHELVKQLTDTLTGKLAGQDKRIRPELFEKLDEFFTLFEYKNVFKDQDLKDIVNKTKEMLSGINPTEINKDKDLLKAMEEEFKKINSEVISSIETFKRSFSFEE